MDNSINVLFSVLKETFLENLASAKSSGALSGDENEAILNKVVLYLTAQSFYPLSNEGKEILKNLKNFI